MKRTFIMPIGRERALEAVRAAPDGFAVSVSEPSRNLSQNAAQWPILYAFADQLQWPVNGAMVHLSADEWKDIISAAFRRETVRVAQGLDGGMVMLGMRTRDMGKREFSEWLDFLHATAAARGVELAQQTEPA